MQPGREQVSTVEAIGATGPPAQQGIEVSARDRAPGGQGEVHASSIVDACRGLVLVVPAASAEQGYAASSFRGGRPVRRIGGRCRAGANDEFRRDGAAAIGLFAVWPQVFESFANWREGVDSGVAITTWTVKLASQAA